ncbi:MAG: hypothetical protein H6760_04905 [Candidatus Nomurabacteria bacterium]|nr:MAG: hypothetical protein H6760_04905 [Candidatus Nomurabacteria bacterium]
MKILKLLTCAVFGLCGLLLTGVGMLIGLTFGTLFFLVPYLLLQRRAHRAGL